MPEPIKAGDGSHTEQTANTPQEAATAAATADEPKTTTTQPRAQEKPQQANSLEDLLEIPDDVRSQLQPKTVKPMEGELPAGHPKAEEQPQQPEQPAEEAEATQVKSEDEDEKEQPGEQQQPEQRIDKRQKRIDRLTRQKSELEEQLDAAQSRLKELEGKERTDKSAATTVALPSGSEPWMPDPETAGIYRNVSQEKAKADSLIRWCNEHSEGIESADGKFITPKEVAGWKQEAQLKLPEYAGQIAVLEREAKRTFKQQQAEFDNASRQAWPELFDKQTEEYQLAQSILDRAPWLNQSPDKNWQLGIHIEGMKSFHARVQDAAKRVATGNGNGVTRGNGHRDISERAFEARVPLAPHTPGPPTREVVPSSHKRLNEAMDQLVADPDGSVANLANVLSAMDETKGARRAGTRAPVKV